MSTRRAKREKKGKAKPKSTKKSRSEIRRRNVQQGKPMNEDVQQVQQVKAKVPVSRVKELAAVQGSMRKKEKKLLESSGIMQVGTYLQEDTSPGPAPSESSELGEQKQSPVVSVVEYKNGKLSRPKYTPQQQARYKAMIVEAIGEHFTIGPAATSVGISRSTAVRWQEDDADFMAACQSKVEGHLDEIEGNMKKITKDLNQPHKVTAAMFMLNGYRRAMFMPMTRHEHTGPGGGPILMGVMAKIRKMSTEELRVELGKLLGPALCVHLSEKSDKE